MLVLLDRDGVINKDTPTGIMKPQEVKLIDGAAHAISRLRSAGWKVAVVTNQSVVGKGMVNEAELAEIHAYLDVLLATSGAALDAIYWCGDHPDHAGPRRKPNDGMLREALRDFGAEAANTPMVGDALRDLQAAQAAGCSRHLVRTGKGMHTEHMPELGTLAPVEIHDDLDAFATYWLQQGRLPD